MDPIVEIPPFRLDRVRGLLLQGDRETRLRRRTWQVLLHLVAHAGRVVPKQELMRAVWAGVTVGDQTLSTSIAELRRALGDDARCPRFIETVHGRGFRFLLTPGAVAARAGDPAATSIASAPADFVGRAEPLAALMAALSRAVRGHRELVLVSGETGVGKTALVLAFESQLTTTLADGEGNTIPIVKTQGQCVEFTGSGESCMPVIGALRLLTRGPDARRVATTIRRLVPRWMAQLLGADDAGGSREPDPGRESRSRTLRLLVETLEELARDTALIFVIEDLQWSDPSTLELLDLLARRRNPARLLVVATLRTGDAPAQADGLDRKLADLVHKGLATAIELAGLAPLEIGAFVERRMVRGAATPLLVTQLRRWTDGNPFLLDELLEQLRREGGIVEGADGWVLEDERSLDAGAPPPSVQAAIDARTALLSAAERASLEAASVFGLSFELEAVAAATSEDAGALDPESLEALFQRLRGRTGMIVGPLAGDEEGEACRAPGLGVYGFRHALFARALRLSIPPARRRRLHRAFGEWCAARSPIRPSAAAHHFEQAADWSRALSCYSQAARSARRRQADPEAIGLFRSALRCLEALPPSIDRDELELPLRVELGGCILGVAGYTDPEVVPLYRRIRTLATRLDRPVMKMMASGGLFFSSMSNGRIHDGYAEAQRLMEEARLLPPVFEDFARSGLGVAAFCLGRLGEARELLEREPGRALPEGVAFDVHIDVLRLGALATVYAHQGELRRGRAAVDEMVSVGRSTGRIYDLANAHRLAADYGAAIGDVALAREHAEATIELADEYGFGQLAAIGRLFVAWADARTGASRDALSVIQASIEDLDQRGYRLNRSTFCARWAEAALEASQPELALKVVEAGLDYVRTSDEVRHESELWRIRVSALRMLGDASRADEAYAAMERALRSARDQHALLFVLRALCEGAVLPGPDRPAARETLRDFVSRAAVDLEGPDLAQARLLLAR